MSETANAAQTVAHHVIAQRVVLEQFMATVFNALGQDKGAVAKFGAHVASVVGVIDPDHPNALAAQEQIPAIVSHVDAILAEVQRNMPK